MVMINQGSVVEIMYPNLFKGLNLKPENLTAYSLPVQTGEFRRQDGYSKGTD